ncbi:MAG: polyphosphate kinase [Pseudoalteromonas rhizosphaerae]|jgi:polyphosphate kinase|uniref:Polyphosphate kinase n=1 Tax=Pseudoalteromonas neustonica TaxID=1840331 RepID=A0ABY3FDE6_9GAMM|nr:MULTISPECIES: polyphosphate kinase 1 [Pseudoalteromonas]MBB1292700.1 polyphosphate kinase 1 [Pseudoalteromonas sp. SR41-4]MBB1302552.1 polyphosphate kinase 1 [Pseudoalteromonas sp. SR44-8]MBB1310740.1 polyphosphate kinase 1 [Pseudoalteromonas sp. SR41-8]MBB1399113.1 polyphosphate kinase 1 [Pseudoalteromonas sp. SG44-8]MBB1410590.1 polyphosphate kinase 1 [Pseudoalteromonas sp. SG44-17]|tara:strand:+ start:9655 stop:11742 length:2088 start_codon:yes stop_codon:yes gene_type:complete
MNACADASQTINYFAPELSWLSFNDRVLQEAKDKNNPIIERIRFLGIFSNNLDEFFRVRVADVKRRILLNKLPDTNFDEDEILLTQIQQKVLQLGKKFNVIHQQILDDLNTHNIHVDRPEQLSEFHINWLKIFFHDNVLQHISPIMLDENKDFSDHINDTMTYLFVEMFNDKSHYAMLEVPTDRVPRFVILPPEKTRRHKTIVMLDDIILFFLSDVFSSFFSFTEIQGYAIKLTRDAEYNLDDELEEGILDKMSKGLKQRIYAEPVRLVYDQAMPEPMLKVMKKRLGVTHHDALIPGGRYRNFRDFIGFPNVGRQYLENKSLPALQSTAFNNHASVFAAISQQDILLYYPYHTFNHLLEYVRQAAFDPRVTQIKVNIYRVASKSRLISSLINAAKNGKKVTVMVELKARFDEQNNIEWAKVLSGAGIKVIFGIPALKVHSKLCIIHRREKGQIVKYAHIGTGNFHEKTAKIYTDFSLFTKHQGICDESDSVFKFIESSYKPFMFEHLMISPVNARQLLLGLIHQEITHVENGHTGKITLKINNLVDKELVDCLYLAARSGVKIRIIVRGMCSLVPGLNNFSDNIRVISIVDRFLEHPRVMIFGNNGDEKVYISSADWMTRNLDHRVEVGVPIYDEKLKQLIVDVLELQFKDRTKARIIDSEQKNHYVRRGNRKKIRSQIAIYDHLKKWEGNYNNE